MGLAAEFLNNWWARGWPADHWVEIRDLTHGKARSRYTTKDMFASEPDLTGPQFVTYSCAAVPDQNPAKNATVAWSPGAWFDIDLVAKESKGLTSEAEARELAEPVVAMLRDLPMPPSAIYYSGGGLHGYYRASTPTSDMALVRRVNEHLAKQLEADASAVNPGRVLRLPGTRNARIGCDLATDGPPVLCAPWPNYPQWERDYDLHALLEIEGPGGTLNDPFAALGDALGGAPRDWDAVETAIRAGTNWNSNVRDRVASMYQRGVAEVDILAHAAANWTLPGYTEAQTRQEVQDLLDRAKEKWPAPVPSAPGDLPGQELTYEQWRALHGVFDERANRFVNLRDGSYLTHQAWELVHAGRYDVELDENGKDKRVYWVNRYKRDLEKLVVSGSDVMPKHPPVCRDEDGVLRINLWRPNPAVRWAEEGDPNGPGARLFDELMMYLCGGRRHIVDELYRWCAASLYRDSERMRWSVLLVSEIRGSGKSLAASIVQALHYAPSTASLETLGALTGKFNGWLAGKTMVVCHETIDASQSAFTAMEALKSSITEERTMLEAKGRDKQSVRAWARYWFNSNSLDGLPFDATERRIFAVVCEATEPREEAFYTAVGTVCLSDDGLRSIAALLRQFADEPLALRAPASDTALIQGSLVPPWVDVLNEEAQDRGDVALRGKDMNAIVKHLTGQSLRGGGQVAQLRRGGWRSVRTTIGGQNARFWVRGDVPEQIDTTFADKLINGDSGWI